MTDTEAQVRMVIAWAMTHLQSRVRALREDDPERGDGILVWVIMVSLLAVAAIAVVVIVVTKAKTTARNTNTQ